MERVVGILVVAVGVVVVGKMSILDLAGAVV